MEQADVWLGNAGSVPLVVQEDVWVSLTADGRRDLRVKVVYDGPIPAPIANGSQVAELEITAPGLEPRRIPLIAGDDGAGGQHVRPDVQRARLSRSGARRDPAARNEAVRASGRRMTRPGRLVTFEGGEGAGKSTQIERLAATLRAAGLDPLVTREPGGTPGAEQIRGCWSRARPIAGCRSSETLLLLAARYDHVVRRDRARLGGWTLGAM